MKRIQRILNRILLDIILLFRRRKLFIYSWLKYDGNRLVHNNWGDDINVLFFESISQYKVIDVRSTYLFNVIPVKGYCCVGSIIGNFYTRNEYEVWGSGIIEKNKQLKSKPTFVHSVRGPLTRLELMNNGIRCPEKYGDPALLVSRYYRKRLNKIYKVGIIPHIIDENNIILKTFRKLHPEVLIIHMKGYNDWRDIPDQVMQCERILSSSLHGLIVADSYCVKNSWISFGSDIIGGYFKYQDYFMSVGRSVNSPILVDSVQSLESIIEHDCFSRAYNINFESIFESCPFKDHLKDYRVLPSHKTPRYKTWEEKNMQFFDNIFIQSVEEFEKVYSSISLLESDYFFKVSEYADEKMYSSFQCQWMQLSDCVLSLGTTDYIEAINKLAFQVISLPDIKNYLSDNRLNGDSLTILTMLLLLDLPTPLIGFSSSLQNSLLKFIDVNYSLNENDLDAPCNYLSLYFIKKSVFESFIQKREVVSSFITDTGNDRESNDNNLNTIMAFDITQELVAKLIQSEYTLAISNTNNQPFEDLINETMHYKAFSCINIRKNILPIIKNKYYCDNNLTKVSKEVPLLQSIIGQSCF